MWGRGNGWIFVTLSDALKVIPKTNPKWKVLAGYLTEMVQHLPELQDPKTGHWYQLPVRNADPNNFIESSCTAMFAYGIENAIKQGLVSAEIYSRSVDLAYKGLRQYSVAPIKDSYLTSKNVCKATCIGNKKYYLKRGVMQGKSYGLGSFILFGKYYELAHGLR
jgi:unsaturated rhamnogalacturonyl hydrolase